MAALLRRELAAERVLWLEYGYLQGDDTDAHVDTLARFAPGDAIVFQDCNDTADTHYDELKRMGGELAALVRTRDGRPLSTVPASLGATDSRRRPQTCRFIRELSDHRRRGADSFVRRCRADAEAARIIGDAHPGRRVIQIPCRPLIWQNGSLHCMTMQLPQGLLA